MNELQTKIFALVEAHVKNGGVLYRRDSRGCLLGAVANSEPKSDESYYSKAGRILGISDEESLAIEAGFEDWRGICRVRNPELWQIGADVATKFKVK